MIQLTDRVPPVQSLLCNSSCRGGGVSAHSEEGSFESWPDGKEESRKDFPLRKT